MFYNANVLSPHKSQISNDLTWSAVSIEGILACHGYSFEEFCDAFDMHPFIDRANSPGTGINFSFMGGLPLIFLLAKNCYYQIPKFQLN